MVATIVRRRPRTHIMRDIKQERNEIYKTGVHTNPIVNDAIDKIEQDSRGSGSGTSTASTTIPILLKKRRELERRGESDQIS